MILPLDGVIFVSSDPSLLKIALLSSVVLFLFTLEPLLLAWLCHKKKGNVFAKEGFWELRKKKKTHM